MKELEAAPKILLIVAREALSFYSIPLHTNRRLTAVQPW